MPGSAWSGSRYRHNLAQVLAASDLCGICGHAGAATGDHIVPIAHWPRDVTGKLTDGHDAIDNLQPAHGTRGAGIGRIHNPCPTCGALCNQSKNKRLTEAPSPRSRMW